MFYKLYNPVSDHHKYSGYEQYIRLCSYMILFFLYRMQILV